MADPKGAKGAKPAEGGTGLFHKDHYKEVWYLLAVLLFLGIILERLTAYINYLGFYSWQDLWDRTLPWILTYWPHWQIIALILTITSIVVATYSKRKLKEIEKEDEKIYGHVEKESLLEPAVPNTEKDKEKLRWQKVLDHTHSDNASEWRLAIIEADVMLEDMLKALSYHGDGVGEMLKAVDPTNMLTLDNAWEAHKVRNRIAHSGSDFELNERETKRVVALFESVFKEFQFI